MDLQHVFGADLPVHVVALLVAAALLAGLVDAAVGGGGLVLLPALLLAPGVAPIEALATNKVASVMGTLTSAVTYARRVPFDRGRVLPAAAVAFVAAFAGAGVATLLPADVFTPVVLLVLVAVLVFTVSRPSFGTVRPDREQADVPRAGLRAALLGVVIGFYDGMIGPGTGSFLAIGLVLLLDLSFLQAAAGAKIVNAATNLGALALLIPHGSVHWALGLLLGVANMLGGYAGARIAVGLGSRFVRWMLVLVVSALVIRLAWQMLTD